MLTVVDEFDSQGPRDWQTAAKAVVCQIFNDDAIQKIISHLEKDIASTAHTHGHDYQPSIHSALYSYKLMDTQLDGMLHNNEFFSSDSAYWVDEWSQLGCLAAAAGMKNGNFLANPEDPSRSPKNQKKIEKLPARSASDSLNSTEFDIWMIRDAILETLIKKQRDYGHGNILRFGRVGILIRTHDKLARLSNLLLTQNSPENESITDTYTDIVGYSAIGMMLERRWFGLPLDY